MVAWFGLTQVVIGITALLVTVYLRDIPANAVRLQSYFLGTEAASFRARVWANFSLAFLYMVVPALFMGAAFPIAGEALAAHRKAVGRAVGDVLAANTVGAILGAAVSGLLLIRLLGIERSLQILTVMNIGLGLVVLASLRKPRWLPAAVAAAALGAIAFLAVNHDALRMWDRKYFAIFRSNQPEAFSTPEKVREAVENTDVLYYAEGVESIVSVIKVKGGEQAFLTNGRVEASTHLQAQQVQFTLGHLPMLLNRNPKDVLVVGMGSGMTAGATAVHPGVEQVTLVEIEAQVLGRGQDVRGVQPPRPGQSESPDRRERRPQLPDDHEQDVRRHHGRSDSPLVQRGRVSLRERVLRARREAPSPRRSDRPVAADLRTDARRISPRSSGRSSSTSRTRCCGSPTTTP